MKFRNLVSPVLALIHSIPSRESIDNEEARPAACQQAIGELYQWHTVISRLVPMVGPENRNMLEITITR
jgi:hypothetical protein